MLYNIIAQEVEKNRCKFIERLREAVKIPSVSTEAAHREDVIRIINWAHKELEKLGVDCHQIQNGIEALPDGSALQLPPVLFGRLGSDKHKKTLLIYGHLDVQPAQLSDGWDTEPFELIEKEGKLFGRGTSDDKGPVVAWMNAIETLKLLKIDIPVNIKFILEGMEESGSKGLDEILEAHKHTFLHDVDMVCISDSNWLVNHTPSLSYGLRGICYYAMEVSGPKQDLHSGEFGGVVYEPMNDLIWMLSQLVDVNGKILIEGIDEYIAPETSEELKLYENIDFNMESLQHTIGVKKLITDCPTRTLLHLWRYPALSIHGMEGAFYGEGAKTVIPAKVTGKFSIRLVPQMEPEAIDTLVHRYLNKIWAARPSPNTFHLTTVDKAGPWVTDLCHPHFQAAAHALAHTFGKKPTFRREGGSIPIALMLQKFINASIVLFPIGSMDDMAHSQNEKINIYNYINGIKAFVAYLLELQYV